jgi:hypothetical protein
MKTVKMGANLSHPGIFIVFLAVCGGFLTAADLESYQVIDRLLSLSGPAAPMLIDDVIIFTAPSSCRRAGAAFAHEGFSTVHWFRQLLVLQDPLDAPIPPGKKQPEQYKDSGILFYIHEIPEGLEKLEYRMIIDGLWTIDPANPQSRRDSVSGIEYSVLSLPVIQRTPDILKGPPGTLNFSFTGPPGEKVTVAGSFNGWDPFMYELAENPAGTYSLSIPLPPGKYQYIFFHRGERRLDPYNPSRVYSRDGIPVSEIVIP